MGRLAHWNRVYATKASAEVSWFQAHPTLSLDLIHATGVPRTAPILDVGGGTSRLVDCLLEAGYRRIGVLDIAEASLAKARQRIGSEANQVEWFVSDVTDFHTPHPWQVWHDRAVFHFLTDAADRTAYREVLLQCLSPRGHAILATFGPEGPTRCSGLDVVRYGPETLARELGDDLQLMEGRQEEHRTPSGVLQQFVYCWFRRHGG